MSELWRVLQCGPLFFACLIADRPSTNFVSRLFPAQPQAVVVQQAQIAVPQLPYRNRIYTLVDQFTTTGLGQGQVLIFETQPNHAAITSLSPTDKKSVSASSSPVYRLRLEVFPTGSMQRKNSGQLVVTSEAIDESIVVLRTERCMMNAQGTPNSVRIFYEGPHRTPSPGCVFEPDTVGTTSDRFQYLTRLATFKPRIEPKP